MEKANRKYERARQCIKQAEEKGYPTKDKDWVLELGKVKFAEGQLWAKRAARCNVPDGTGDGTCLGDAMVVD